MDIELLQSQEQQLSRQQLQSIQLLQMSAAELYDFIGELALNNPMVEPAPVAFPDDTVHSRRAEKLKWLEENSFEPHAGQDTGEEDFDPLARVGTDGGLTETLVRHLTQQIDQLELPNETADILRFLAACLDDNGYLRIPPQDLSANSGILLPRLEECLEILRTLDPAGVGAESLSQCLALQLTRQGITGPALTIVQEHLDDLARRNYRTIAAKLGIPMEAVQEAEQIIQTLNPRPGTLFQRPEQVPYVLPDVFVTVENGNFMVHTRCHDRPLFRISSYYKTLLSKTDDRDVRDYLSTKLKQAESVLWAVGQRESTLQRCAQKIVERQIRFFREGAHGLLPLRMSDVAGDLGLHESTISRTVRNKYLQCDYGIYPMNYFFPRAAATGAQSIEMGAEAAKALLRRLVAEEDKANPLSDQKLCEQMAELRCPISRRTVAKYREELNIPKAIERKRCDTNN